MLRSIFGILTIPDKVLITALIILAVTSVFYLRGIANDSYLEVYRDNVLIGTYNMQQDEVITISEGIRAEIKGGKIRMLESICQNQICVKQGFSRSIPVICAPERIALIIKHKKTPSIMITR